MGENTGINLYGVRPVIHPLGVHQTAETVVTWLRATDVKVFAYLDDFFICGDSKEAVLKAVGVVRGILENLGFLINDGKSVESPVQVMEFLGFSIDPRAMTMFLTGKKRLAITEICRSLISRSRITVHDLAAVLGLLS